MSREDRKAEEALKALLKQPSNRRCANCEALGPQYVVSAFNVFVCTVCSGVHRQFGHRVKGVSMSTFKKDEVETLRQSGNEKFAAFFLHKWTPAALPKPVDRDVPRVQTWITAVYQDRRFYAEPPGGWTAGAAAPPSAAGSTVSESGEPAVRPLAEVLGSNTPKLQVQHSSSGDAAMQLERSVSAASSTAAAPTPTGSATVPAPVSAAVAPAAAPLDLLDVSSPKSAKSAPPGAVPGAAAAPAWDPFGAGSPVAAAAAAPAGQASPARAAAPAAEGGWASFVDVQAPVQPQQAAAAAPAAQAAPAATPAANGDADNGWEAFGDGPTAEPAAAAAPAAPPAAAAAPAPSSSSSSPSKPPKVPVQATRSASRPEVPMDVFYPEFEQIRATGMLPTGKPVPLHAFPSSYGASQQQQQQHAYHASPQQHAVAANPYANPYAYQHDGAQQGGGYGGGAPQRPTIAIPPAPLHPGYAGGYAPSPGIPSPGPYSSPSAYSPSPAGSAPSPAGSFGYASHHGANGAAAYGAAAAPPFPNLRSSTDSLGNMLPGTAAPTPAAHRLGDPDANDPFAGLAPGLRAALPAAAAPTAKWGGAPPPTPAGGPPFAAPANGSAAPPFPAGGQFAGAAAGGPFAGASAAAPFGGAPAPALAGLAPATAAASATLFGRTPSLTGYDLGAPAAPKPQTSGNPFA